MKVEWGTQDTDAWDAAHAQTAGPLQQDWAYGSTMLVSGGTVIRAVIQADGQTVGLAQCVCYLREKLIKCKDSETRKYYKRIAFDPERGYLKSRTQTRKKKDNEEQE